MKSTVTAMKNILEGLSSRLDEQKKDQWFVKTGQRNSYKHSSKKTKELLIVKITYRTYGTTSSRITVTLKGSKNEGKERERGRNLI